MLAMIWQLHRLCLLYIGLLHMGKFIQWNYGLMKAGGLIYHCFFSSHIFPPRVLQLVCSLHSVGGSSPCRGVTRVKLKN